MAKKQQKQATDEATGNKFAKPDFVQVLLALENKTMRELHVADLAVAKSIQKSNEADQVVSVVPFPIAENKEEAAISAACLDEGIYNAIAASLDASKGYGAAICLVIYMNYNSLANFKQIKKSGKLEVYNSSDTMHSANNGIIVALGRSLNGYRYKGDLAGTWEKIQ